jgi:hypothetical protein
MTLLINYFKPEMITVPRRPTAAVGFINFVDHMTAIHFTIPRLDWFDMTYLLEGNHTKTWSQVACRYL